ncbi:MAG: hypothetical protein HC909_01805 [Blastochloris sp.]|nr:hypothetical protein [Blastochloris sp.]
MKVRKLFFGAVAILCSSTAAFAGPCTAAIDRTQAEVDVLLAARAASGPTATESARATMHRQPNPDSIAAAEAKLGDLSPETRDAIAVGLARAREADKVGNARACEEALDVVRHAIAPRAD